MLLKAVPSLGPVVHGRKLMDEFSQAVTDVQVSCSALLEAQCFTLNKLPEGVPCAGVYMFSENGQVLYVGRTNNLRMRLRYHTRNSHNQATFAFLLARHNTGQTKATYKKRGSRADLLRDPTFRSAFDKARERIREMNIQFIEESDPIRQSLLEICAALRTGAKYNSFDNH